MKKELISLRAAMAEARIDAYVIPTDDFHGSEYVGDYFKCRSYISGFTGSAGTLVVTRDFAGLWTDGRYFLQAAQQLAGTGIDLMKMGEPGVPTIAAKITELLEPGQVLGFDGRCATCASGEELEQAAIAAGATICYSRDLAGDVWPDRPAMSDAPVWELATEYAGRSRSEKLTELRTALKDSDADMHLLTSLDDIAWLLNIRGDDVACCPVVLSYLLFTEADTVLYVDTGKLPAPLQAALIADGITLRPYLQVYEDIKTLPPAGTLLLDPAKTNFTLLRDIPAGIRILKRTNPTTLPKAIKNDTEVANERIAHIRDGVALTKFMKWVKDHVGKEPITEISAAAVLERFREEQPDYLGPSFSPIMGYGHHGAIIHYGATPESDIPLQAEGFLLADTGGHYLQGSTDVTRTFVLGPLTEEMRFHYTLVLKSHLQLLRACFKKGCSGVPLDLYARTPFWEQGLDYNHGTGHGVGYLLSVHEGPQRIMYRPGAGTDAPAEFVPGMITSDEPGIYLEGKYGIRLENLTVCREAYTNEYGTFYCFDALTMCPFEPEAINLHQLTVEEKQALNDYHALVYQNLSPYFEGEALSWLQNITAAV